MTGIAAVGFIVAAYLTYTKLTSSGALFCTEGGGCDVVQSSRYATFLWVPTALWGAAMYVALGALALAGLTAQRWLWAFLLSVAAVSFSAYLTFISATVIKALCGYCLVSGAAAAVLFGLLLYRKPAAGGRSALRPSRVATLASVTAVVTVVLGAFVFAAGTSPGETAYKEALARHLSQTGAIMYGAYW
jgi:uncharacterized membrane protein